MLFVQPVRQAAACFRRSVGGVLTFLNFSDWLGTERLRTLATGVPCETITSLPFGDDQITSGSCADSSPMHFTGKQRDTESGLDNFGVRYDSSALGRFMSPDNPKFSEKADPQTWNLFSYVSNNPIARVDLTGDNWFNIGGSFPEPWLAAMNRDFFEAGVL